MQAAELRMKPLEPLESGEGLRNLLLVPKAHGHRVEHVAVFGDMKCQRPSRLLGFGVAAASRRRRIRMTSVSMAEGVVEGLDVAAEAMGPLCRRHGIRRHNCSAGSHNGGADRKALAPRLDLLHKWNREFERAKRRARIGMTFG